MSIDTWMLNLLMLAALATGISIGIFLCFNWTAIRKEICEYDKNGKAGK